MDVSMVRRQRSPMVLASMQGLMLAGKRRTCREGARHREGSEVLRSCLYTSLFVGRRRMKGNYENVAKCS